MEPLSALSVAAAAVQFLDYGSRIFLDARDIMKSSAGQASWNTQLTELSQNLASLMKEVDSKLQAGQNQQTSGGQDVGPSYEGHSQDMFLRLCRECNDVCSELQDCLSKLEIHSHEGLKHAADSIVAALKGVWSASKIEGLKERIRQLRDQIMMAALVILWGQAQKSHTTSLEIKQRQMETMSQLSTIDGTTRKFGDELLNLAQGQTQESRMQAQGIVNSVLDSDWEPGDAMGSQMQQEDKGSVGHRHRNHAQQIVNSLLFETIRHREGAIPKPYADTFEWIFSKPRQDDEDKPLWVDFTQWLSTDSDQIYWITGKPGAGKSTLTKFIAMDERLEHHLKTWAGSFELVLTKYFSWNAGTQLQKSQQGLLRTILHKCLSTRPELLVPVVFPARWSLVQMFSKTVNLPSWKPEELNAGFRNLVSHAGRRISSTYSGYRLALLIDGLDEFEMDQGNHQPLVDLIQEANKNPNVKICASSRPWNVFRDAFSQSPMLQLEMLTHEDIKLYVQNKFSMSRGFLERKATHPDQAEELLKEIVKKAMGVFLWVSVVVVNLLHSLQEGDDLSQVQKTLDSLPKDLSDLFQVMWERTNPSHRREASHYYGVMKCFERLGMTPLALSIGLGDDQEVSIDIKIDPANANFSTGMVTSLNRKLTSRTKGLLEVHRVDESIDCFVTYMHRTAREWVQENWDTLMEASEPGFDANLWVLKGETLRLPIENFGVVLFSKSFWSRLEKLISISRVARNTTKLVQILDRLDREVAKFSHGRSGLLRGVCSPGDHKSSSTSSDREAIHWGHAVTAAAKHPGWGRWGQLNFLGIMAQVPVSQYVYAKVSAEPSAVQARGNEMPVLVNAILGGFEEFPMRCELGSFRWDEESRRNLVEFLLDYVSPEETQRSLDLVCSITERWVTSPAFLKSAVEMLQTKCEMSGCKTSKWEKLLNRFRRIRKRASIQRGIRKGGSK